MIKPGNVLLGWMLSILLAVGAGAQTTAEKLEAIATDLEQNAAELRVIAAEPPPVDPPEEPEEPPVDPPVDPPEEPEEPPVEPPPAGGLGDAYPGFTRIGLGVDSTGNSVFAEGVTRTVRTQAEMDSALSAMKSGSVDWIVIDGSTVTIPMNGLSGIRRSADKPARFSTSGAGRLNLEIQDHRASFHGIAFDSVAFGREIQFRGAWKDILFEDCWAWFDCQGTNLGSATPGTPAMNLQIRRTTIRDHWGAGARIQGIYTWNLQGLLLQECWLHHNGWRPGASRSLAFAEGGASIHNHNAYINQPGSGVVIDHCVSTEASSHGIHLKCGGVIVDCLSGDNPIGFQPAYGGDGYYGIYGLVPSTLKNCVAVGAADISSTNPRGNFAWLTNLKDGLIEGNVAIANTTSPTNDAVFWIDRKSNPTGDMLLKNNRAYGWPGGIFISPGSTPVGTINQQGNQLGLALQSHHGPLLDRVRLLTSTSWNGGKPGVSRALLDEILAEARR